MARVINSPTRFAPNTARFSAIRSRRIVRTARFFSLTDPSFQKHLSSSLTPSVSRRQPVRASNSQTATEKKLVSDDRMLVFVPPHPLIKHWVSVLRNEQTPCPIFKNAMAELGRLLIYEASRDWLPTVFGEIQSPMGVASVEFIDPREPVTDNVSILVQITCPFRFKWEIEKDRPEEVTSCDSITLSTCAQDILDCPNCQLFWIQILLGKESEKVRIQHLSKQAIGNATIVPILRAGLALVEHAPSILPATKTYHLGISRNEETLQPFIYLNKLPDNLPEGSRVFVVDPMLATGGTIVAAIDLLKERGVDNKQIKVISAVAAPPALQKLSERFPGLHVYTGTIDPTVNEKGFIVPGLGDAGDRSFGT